MKLISPEKQAKVQLRIEIASAAVLATVLVSVLFVLTDPGFTGVFQASLQRA